MNAGPMLTPEQALTSCLQYHCSGEVYPWHVQVPRAETSISLYVKGVRSWGEEVEERTAVTRMPAPSWKLGA